MSEQVANQQVQSSEFNAHQSNAYKTGRSMNAQHLRLTFMHTLKSEIVKLRGLASTWWCMALTIVLPVIFSFIIAIVQKAMSKVDIKNGANQGKSSAAITVGPSNKGSLIASQDSIFHLVISFASVSLIVLAIFAVLAVTAEHSTTSIQASLTAVPRRGMFFTAKFIAVAIYVFVVQLIAMAVSLGAAELAFIGDSTSGLSGSNAWKLPLTLFLGSPAIMVVVAAMAYGFGMICKSTAGGIMCVIGAVMILPSVLSIIMFASNFAKWNSILIQLLPATAVEKFLGGSPNSGAQLPPNAYVFTWWQSGLVVLAWGVVMYAIGHVVEKHRDI
ncbi:ABC transporter permease subunit [Gardnerella vaginalis]|uniref:ABC transporter permease subunit n=1 Tax=Gardnerella vaginalis TaxID=2702 RepID=UPI000C9AFE55|nr:ABC transporter permease subunit [Gardnerella vaginalis]MDK7211629.1 ABC transporter permease subunit [Gardnerella vaginalis]MDK7259811.1 ABC transporter permease subunit [Gardnerella vaginalis]MDK8337279.1 ABC transporter permease subunit [Gardnerella vaginalis]MDK8776576.1 ABC transporter permease subunit [Gardnerella vaginalis]PMC50197.1 ABC transporter permease [Gardnerella vaginalis]